MKHILLSSLAIFISNQKALFEHLSSYFNWNNKYLDPILALIFIPTLVILSNSSSSFILSNSSSSFIQVPNAH